MKYQLVDFKNGKFGVRRIKKVWFFKEKVEYLSDAAFWWDDPEHIKRWCYLDRKTADKLFNELMMLQPSKKDGLEIIWEQKV